MSYIFSMVLKIPTNPIVLVIAIMYVEKLKKAYPKAKGESGCTHRLFFVALMIAHKYLSHTNRVDTFPFKLDWHAQSTAFSKEELDRMEFEFLTFLKFRIFISVQDFWYFLDNLQEESSEVVPENSISRKTPKWIEATSIIAEENHVPQYSSLAFPFE